MTDLEKAIDRTEAIVQLADDIRDDAGALDATFIRDAMRDLSAWAREIEAFLEPPTS